MVNHSDIIPKEFLPTYNSNVIESYLHQISGLSDIFLYFNDDVFIRSFLHPSDLFTADYGLKLFVENLTIPMSKTQQRIFIAGVKDKPYWRAFFGTIQLLKNSFGEENMKPLRLLQHTPHTFHRGAIERVHKLWKKEFKSVHHHKFRQDGDILFIVSRNMGGALFWQKNWHKIVYSTHIMDIWYMKERFVVIWNKRILK